MSLDAKTLTPIIIALLSAVGAVWHSGTTAGAVRDEVSAGSVEYVRVSLESRDIEIAELRRRIAVMEKMVDWGPGGHPGVTGKTE